jgi:hypothetical protein
MITFDVFVHREEAGTLVTQVHRSDAAGVLCGRLRYSDVSSDTCEAMIQQVALGNMGVQCQDCVTMLSAAESARFMGWNDEIQWTIMARLPRRAAHTWEVNVPLGSGTTGLTVARQRERVVQRWNAIQRLRGSDIELRVADAIERALRDAVPSLDAVTYPYVTERRLRILKGLEHLDDPIDPFIGRSIYTFWRIAAGN